MFCNNKPLRIGKVWDLTDDQITDKTPDDVKLIILYRNKFLSKVNTGEWTLEEYKNFSSGIKKMYTESLVNFNDIFDCFLELSKEEVLEEIKKLIEKGFIKTDLEINVSLLSNVINEICSRIFSISYNISLNAQDNNANLPPEEKTEIYNTILEQLNIPNSDYANLLISIFEDWVNKYFSNKKLKKVILDKKAFIISNRKEKVRKQLNKNLRTIKKMSDVYDRYQYVNITSYKAKRLINKK